VITATALLAVPAASAAPPVTVYNNVPSPLPGNTASWGFEATQTSEYGGKVALAGTERDNPNLTVGFSSWGCEGGTWNGGNCSTTPGAKFTHRVKFNIYEVGANDEPGELISRVTRNLEMPYRPSANYTHCNGADAGKWYKPSTGNCYNGRLFVRSIGLGGVELPDEVIVGVAYNTTHYGSSPIGESAPCFTEDGGCAYDALNVATSPDAPTVGSQPNPDDAYVDSTWAGAYCDNGAGGTGFFRLDAGCNTGFQPMFKIRARP
jgi:hypothetical protein